MVMAIDTVCNLFTEHEVTNGQTGLDEHFLEQIRFPVEWRKGVSIDDYIGMKDRAGIERSLLIAVRAGDQRVRGSFEIPYEQVAAVCRKHPERFSGLAGIDPYRGMDGVRELE